MLLSTLAIAYSFLIAGIFLTAGLSKFRPDNRAYYQQTIEDYEVVPKMWAGPLVRIIATVEVTVAILSIIPSTQKIGLLLAALVLSTYCYSFVKQLEQGKEGVLCGCAGPASELTVNSGLVFRNAALIILSIIACFSLTSEHAVAWSIVIPAAIVIGLAYVSVEQLLNNNQKIQALRLSQL